MPLIPSWIRLSDKFTYHVHIPKEQGNPVSVIILTAYDTFSFVQRALRLGAVDYLLKPFHDGDLENAVTRMRKTIKHAPSADIARNIAELKKGTNSKYVLEAMEYINTHYNEPVISMGSVAEHLGISEGHLSHTFKKETDTTLLNYLTRYRIHKAMALLKDCRVKVYEVAQIVGYRDIAYFSATFKKIVGMSPSGYQDTRD